MAIDFPSSPTTGQQYTYAGKTYVFSAQGTWVPTGGGAYTASSTAPVTPTAGDHWYDLSTGVLSIWINDGTSSQWVMVSPGGGGASLVPQSGRLTYVSTTALSFAPYNGNQIKINGTLQIIPTSGIAGLTNTTAFVNGTGGSSLAASTTYYVYAFMNSSTVTADFSTTGHATSTAAGNEGVEIKSGDNTRTLIGMVRTNVSSQFQDNAANRLVISWFNRRFIQGTASFTVNRATASTVPVELDAEIRTGFLTWGEEDVAASCSGAGIVDGVATLNAGIAFDGTTYVAKMVNVIASNGYTANIANAGTFRLAEGFHYLTLVGCSNGGTATFQSDDTLNYTAKCRTFIGVRG